jgi:hypothetical protein
MENATKEKNAAYHKEHSKKMQANPTESYKANKERSNAKSTPKVKVQQQAAKDNKFWYCEICEVNCIQIV